ncbi:unnamed protein product [Cylicocyclus nassatus]|uniref:Ubiquitin-like domain-containing protein n=1 Tax=Cylicocyclus nassatus TaxID=53992 RepID=A0AA36GY56_CYLNA|nr:unnamed protein product [Cylicocyclus nassatus]
MAFGGVVLQSLGLERYLERQGQVPGIKARIEALEGVSVQDQQLIFAGRQLDDDEVEPYSTLHFSLRYTTCCFIRNLRIVLRIML